MLNTDAMSKAASAINLANDRAGGFVRFSLTVDLLTHRRYGNKTVMGPVVYYSVSMLEANQGSRKTLIRTEDPAAFVAVAETCNKIALAFARI